jgi:4-alpha-glucanotransferase
MDFQRRAGVLLHPTSLPSKGGIGDMGPAAYAFVDFLHDAGQGLWQILPLNPVGLGNSPYSATSAFAGNTLLISLERLAEHGWLAAEDVKDLPEPNGRVDFVKVNALKLPVLRKAARNFLSKPPDALGEHERFRRFCADDSWWLEDYVLFECLREMFGGQSWNQWPRGLASREPGALDKARTEHAEALQIGRVLQFAFFEQWKALREYCSKKNVRIVGDVAIFVNFDSADVWTNPDLFYLDANLQPTIVSGVPPDAFSKTGQRWGNPLYRWDVIKERGYKWWIQRMSWALGECDYIRLDHFRGFQQYWEIPGAEPTAINGHWVDGPKDDLFHALRAALGDLPFIAEDLGLITPDVVALRERLGVPGMKVMQFGFSDPGAHIYLPHRFEKNCVAYTGTHDNDTTVGWFAALSEKERAKVVSYLGETQDGIHWSLTRAVMNSPANFAIVPLQDMLGLKSDARMNTPSETDGNWGWRFEGDVLGRSMAQKLRMIVEMSDRLPG